MDKRTGFTWADFFNYTLGTWFYVGLAIVIPILLTLLCLLLYLRG
jgi:heme exporter protein D